LQRDQEAVALVLVDIDHFKIINDAHGHAVGDRALVALAALLRDNTRSGDVLVRYGGEEFVLVLPGMPSGLAREFCERLRERVAAHAGFCPEVPELRMTISLGLAAAPPFDAQNLLKAADLALYCAKHDGRNRVRVAAQASAADHATVLAPDHHGR
jgi:diguanylate cyclase (GGDEF)-like protein